MTDLPLANTHLLRP